VGSKSIEDQQSRRAPKQKRHTLLAQPKTRSTKETGNKKEAQKSRNATNQNRQIREGQQRTSERKQKHIKMERIKNIS
jgi:hypothetical protein